ncbi:putative peptide chain release factor 1, mitochondrial, partial [Neolecta irregularis DAH-3]
FDNVTAQVSSATGFSDTIASQNKRLVFLEPIAKNLREYDNLQNNLDELRHICLSKDLDLKRMAEEECRPVLQKLDDLFSGLTASLLPRSPHEDFPALIEIRTGIGGDEAALFAGDLYRMYERYAATKGWSFKPLSVSTTEGDGLNEGIVSIKGPGAYGRLAMEAGVHRVQRTPATETKGRTHTSTASVNVFPEIEEGNSHELNVADLKIEVMRSRGAGGQHVNKTESAVRITHIPTGINVSMQDSRSQHQNRLKAMLILRSRLAARQKIQHQQEQRAQRRQQVTSTERSDKIRTYNYPQNRVTDHRCGFSLYDLTGLMQGISLDILIDQVQKWTRANELDNLIKYDVQSA